MASTTTVIGIDIGQRVDNTAICVTEKIPGKDGDKAGDRYLVRTLERLPLKTPYPKVAGHIRDVYLTTVNRYTTRLADEQARQHSTGVLRDYLRPNELLAKEAEGSVFVLIDATGCGLPVVDLVREQAGMEDARVTACFFTAGDRCNVSPGAAEGSISKMYMVSRLDVLVQNKKLRIPHSREAKALDDQLLAFEVHRTDDAHMVAGARVGEHDDLITAVGLSVILEAKTYETGSFRYC